MKCGLLNELRGAGVDKLTSIKVVVKSSLSNTGTEGTEQSVCFYKGHSDYVTFKTKGTFRITPSTRLVPSRFLSFAHMKRAKRYGSRALKQGIMGRRDEIVFSLLPTRLCAPRFSSQILLQLKSNDWVRVWPLTYNC